VDFAIPYVYSYRKGVQASARYDEAVLPRPTMDVPLSRIEITEEERRRFLDSAESVVDLADRIRDEGLIQPVVLHRVNEGQYSIVAGHKRVEACKRLAWQAVPAVIRDGK
jgi:ParB/RepB/Spo0J family partition protein